METLNASDAKREFGEVLLKAQKEPIGINRNGKPVAVMTSALEFEHLQAFKRRMPQKGIAKNGLKSLEEGNVLVSDAVFSTSRKRIEDA